MPARVRAVSEAFHLTSVHNQWEFAAPPVDVTTLRAVGSAIRAARTLRFDYATAEGVVSAPGEADFHPPIEVEPHYLVVWAGRWYLIARNGQDATWTTYRVDRLRPKTSTGRPFEPQGIGANDITRL